MKNAAKIGSGENCQHLISHSTQKCCQLYKLFIVYVKNQHTVLYNKANTLTDFLIYKLCSVKICSGPCILFWNPIFVDHQSKISWGMALAI